VVNFILQYKGYENLSGFDSVVLCDDDNNLCMPILCLRLEKFEFEDMKKYLLKKTAEIHRGRSKLVKIFG